MTPLITLTNLSVQEINLLIAGLGKLPLEISADLWGKVRQQTEAQLPPKPELPVNSAVEAHK